MFGKGVLREHSAALNAVLRLLDVFILIFAGLVAFYLLFNNLAITSPYKVGLLTASLSVAILFPVFDMYRVWRGQSRAEEFRVVLLSVTGVFIALVLMGYISEILEHVDRRWVGLWYVLSIVLAVAVRLTLRNFLRVARSHGYNQRRVVVFGEGDLGIHVISRINRSPFLCMPVVG